MNIQKKNERERKKNLIEDFYFIVQHRQIFILDIYEKN